MNYPIRHGLRLFCVAFLCGVGTAAALGQESRKAALSELWAVYPEVPNAGAGGAADPESTYLHLLVNWLEFRALVQLLGQEEAGIAIEEKDIYQWIYRRILTDGSRLESVVSDMIMAPGATPRFAQSGRKRAVSRIFALDASGPSSSASAVSSTSSRPALKPSMLGCAGTSAMMPTRCIGVLSA